MSNKYGYVRVSTKEQKEDRQLIALRDIGIPKENIYIDKESEKDFNRTRYKRLIHRLEKDDILYIKSIDRLGRSYEEVIEQWKFITKDKKADIVVIEMPLLDTRRGKDLMGTFLSDIVLALLSYVAENERTTIRKRQAEGIAAAKEKGIRFGPKPMELPGNFMEIKEMWRRGEITTIEAAIRCGMARTTFYNRAKEDVLTNVENRDKQEKIV